jgi:hypothetical protein
MTDFSTPGRREDRFWNTRTAEIRRGGDRCLRTVMTG